MELTLSNIKGLLSAEGELRSRTRESLTEKGLDEATVEFALNEAKEELEMIEYIKGAGETISRIGGDDVEVKPIAISGGMRAILIKNLDLVTLNFALGFDLYSKVCSGDKESAEMLRGAMNEAVCTLASDEHEEI
jgi:hypothetical protein